MLFYFDVFELDVANATVRREQQAVALTPKAFAMLQFLVEHAGQLVTKNELWRAVWPGVIVTDAALTVCMSEIRKAFCDPPRRPRFIETVHRRGYRFIAPLARAAHRQGRAAEPAWNAVATVLHEPVRPVCAGRHGELAQLDEWLERALRGRRQLVFITGEPGIGKTTLVDAFIARSGAGTLAIGCGQCIEHYGTSEPYLPLLDALGRMCRGPLAAPLIARLERHAPGWLAQMPALLDDAGLVGLQRRNAGATRERMLRELSEALEVIAADMPLVLCLEDLHWSDHSTLDWLGFMARRPESARLLILCTYRPVEVIVHNHPLRTLKHELRAHGQCEELPLSLLGEAGVRDYLEARFALPAEARAGAGVHSMHGSLLRFARALHRRTDGNPLFMRDIVEHLLAHGALVERDGQWQVQDDIARIEQSIPSGPQQMIVRQFERLTTADRQLLEVASVAGMDWSCVSIATALSVTAGAAEERCAGLARNGQFLRAAGLSEWPDGTLAARYGFTHALYREVVYDRVSAGRRIELHRAIGAQIEQACGEHTQDCAAELAVHFERGHDYPRAARYCRLAGQVALQRAGQAEAIAQFERGLSLLGGLTPSAALACEELDLNMALGPLLIASKGNASPLVEACYGRARELCQELGAREELFAVLFGLRSIMLARGNLRAAHDFGGELLLLAEGAADAGRLLEAHLALGNTFFQLGDPSRARAHLEQGIALYDPVRHRGHSLSFGMDPGMFCLSLLALSLQLLGYLDQALARSAQALALAETLDHPYSRATAANFAGWLHQLRGEPELTRTYTATVLALCAEHEFPSACALATIRHGWARAVTGEGEAGSRQIQQGLQAWEALGARFARAHFLALLAEACATNGRVSEGLAHVNEALAEVERSDERWLAAELRRVQGDLLVSEAGLTTEAEAAWLAAIAIAREQAARFLELRAAVRLGGMWRRQGKARQAAALLDGIHAWFTEGAGTAEMRLASQLLYDVTAKSG